MRERLPCNRIGQHEKPFFLFNYGPVSADKSIQYDVFLCLFSLYSLAINLVDSSSETMEHTFSGQSRQRNARFVYQASVPNLVGSSTKFSIRYRTRFSMRMSVKRWRFMRRFVVLKHTLSKIAIMSNLHNQSRTHN